MASWQRSGPRYLADAYGITVSHLEYDEHDPDRDPGFPRHCLSDH